MNKKIGKLVGYCAAGFLILCMAATMQKPASTKDISYSEFITMVDSGDVEKVEISDSTIKVYPYGEKVVYHTGVLDDDSLVQKLIDEEVDFKRIEEKSASTKLFLNLISLVPTVLLIVFMVVMMKSMSNKGGGLLSVGKNKSKVYIDKNTGVTFADVAGQDEAKESLKEIIDYLENSEKYVKIGAKLPKGALLVGPPGTGKTLLAKAVAGEAKVPFFNLSGSDFVEMFVGVGASRVRDLFEEAKKNAPCIIFIDEIDAIGKSRDAKSSNDEREQTLNQLLAEMDGFDSNKAIVVLAATNRPETLDKALLRPGRFDRRIIVDKPDFNGRKATLEVHSKNVVFDESVNLDDIARATSGAAGADLANIINEAALRAVRLGKKAVAQDDLQEAVEVVFAGKEKKDRIMTEKERRIVSYHEVGHAVVAALQKNSAPVQKITIVPRTMGALGYTMQIPEEEKYLSTSEDIITEITTLLGGRCAEEIFCNVVTTGASNDIERATEAARKYVTIYGMSEKFGMMALENVRNSYLDGVVDRTCSDTTSTSIDNEILSIITDAKATAMKLLKENKELVTEVAQFLLTKENITGDEFMGIFRKYHPDKNAGKLNVSKTEESSLPLTKIPLKEEPVPKKINVPVEDSVVAETEDGVPVVDDSPAAKTEDKKSDDNNHSSEAENSVAASLLSSIKAKNDRKKSLENTVAEATTNENEASTSKEADESEDSTPARPAGRREIKPLQIDAPQQPKSKKPKNSKNNKGGLKNGLEDLLNGMETSSTAPSKDEKPSKKEDVVENNTTPPEDDEPAPPDDMITDF